MNSDLQYSFGESKQQGMSVMPLFALACAKLKMSLRPIIEATGRGRRLYAWLDCNGAVSYGKANATKWTPPRELARYEGLARLVETAESLGVQMYSVPSGWFSKIDGDVAATYHLGQASVVFIEQGRFEPFELADTICHELIHCTAVRAGRRKPWTYPRRGSLAYWQEEGCAIVGANSLARAYGLPYVAQLRPEWLLDEVVKRFGINREQVLSDASKAVAMLTL